MSNSQDDRQPINEDGPGVNGDLGSWLYVLGGIPMMTLFFVVLFSIPVVAYHLLHLWSRTPRPALQAVKPVLYGIMLFLILVNAGSGASFIYFQF